MLTRVVNGACVGCSQNVRGAPVAHPGPTRQSSKTSDDVLCTDPAPDRCHTSSSQTPVNKQNDLQLIATGRRDGSLSSSSLVVVFDDHIAVSDDSRTRHQMATPSNESRDLTHFRSPCGANVDLIASRCSTFRSGGPDDERVDSEQLAKESNDCHSITSDDQLSPRKEADDDVITTRDVIATTTTDSRRRRRRTRRSIVEQSTTSESSGTDSIITAGTSSSSSGETRCKSSALSLSLTRTHLALTRPKYVT